MASTWWCTPPRNIWAGTATSWPGVVCGRRELIERIDGGVFPLLGGKLSPFDGWLLVRGLRTLPLRMRRHHDSGLAIARRLADHPAVRRVHHPLLGEPGPGAATLSGASGLFSIELDRDQAGIARFCDALPPVQARRQLGRP